MGSEVRLRGCAATAGQTFVWLANRPCVGKRERRLAEREGFEPPCRLPGKTLSRRPRYDHFGTSPLLLRSGQSPSLRARGRLRRLPSGARLRPQALITTLGAKPLAARSRSPSATAFQRSLAAAGALFLRAVATTYPSRRDLKKS